MQWTVRPYTPADEAEWDRFVMHESGNGTFLQTRNFLNYHPAGRFTDASLMVYNEHGGLGAVVPAALRLNGATRIFRSHPGSTFGGPVLRSTYNSAAKSIGILQAVEDYIATRYDAADFRPTPDLFNGVENVALQYAFTYLGYTQQTAEALRQQVQYVVDFDGPALKALPPDAPVKAVVTSDANGKVLESIVYRNPVTEQWRMTLRIQRQKTDRPIELRAFLQHDNHAVSETWTHIILPE